MEKNRTFEKNAAVFCTTMIIGTIIIVSLLNMFGALYKPTKQPEPKKTELVHGDSITVICPSCGMCIERELNEKNYTNQ